MPNVSIEKSSLILSLTGIRGIAAFWVVLFHLQEGIPSWPTSQWLHGSALLRNGFRGVDLFFILSGFIMMHVHARDFSSITAGKLRSFALMRIFRIYPASFAASLLILILVLSLPSYVIWMRAYYETIHTEAYTAKAFIQSLTLSSRWLGHDYGMWNPVTWSLSVELFAYTSLPVLASLLGRTKSPAKCLIFSAGSLTVMILLLLVLGDRNGATTSRLGLVRGFGGFAAGIGMCRFVSLVVWNEKTPPRIASGSVLLIGLLSLHPRAGILMPFPFATLIASLSYQRGIIDAFLRTRIVLFLGKISFSLYLTHLTLFAVLEWLFQSAILTYTVPAMFAALAVYLVVAIGLSAALYQFVERPFHRIGHRLARNTRVIETDSIPVIHDVIETSGTRSTA